LERSVCRKADLVVNSDRTRGRIQQMLYRLPQPPLWLRTSLSRNYPVPKPSPARRRELLGGNPPADAVAVLCPSIANEERLALELIQSLMRLPQRFRFAMIAGTGSYFQACVQLVEKHGLGQRMTFLPRMGFDLVMEYVVCADVGAILHDGRQSLGNYLANPMRLTMFASAGIPFVASDFPALAGEVYRYGLGVCCHEHDPEKIGDAIRHLAEGVPTLAERKPRIVEAFRNSLCFEASADALVERLKNWVAQPSGPP
jgi:glycosyltransferase involved in cell wall biosynthesis